MRNLIRRAVASADTERHHPARSQLRSGRREGSPAHRGDDTEFEPHATMNDVDHDVVEPIIRDLDGWRSSARGADPGDCTR